MEDTENPRNGQSCSEETFLLLTTLQDSCTAHNPARIPFPYPSLNPHRDRAQITLDREHSGSLAVLGQGFPFPPPFPGFVGPVSFPGRCCRGGGEGGCAEPPLT